MKHSDMIETLKSMPLEELLPLKKVMDDRLFDLESEEAANLRDNINSVIYPTAEQSIELDRIIEERKNGAIEMLSKDDFFDQLSSRLDL